MQVITYFEARNSFKAMLEIAAKNEGMIIISRHDTSNVEPKTRVRASAP